jgi:LuxR family maltose regulon positive regulatory protein
MAKQKNDPNPYYFPERLTARLAKISEHSLTVVEAPSGFGKTTAVREYLAARDKEATREKSYTCLGESPEKAWAGICGLFSGPESTIAEELAELGVPTPETLPDIVALLRKYHCRETSYFVIDNYQLFATAVQKKLITALGACQDKNLHIIVITQPLKGDQETTHPGNPCHTITPQDFLFDHAAITKYCRLAGIKISAEAVEYIQTSSEGWIAAIRLQLKHYAEKGGAYRFRRRQFAGGNRCLEQIVRRGKSLPAGSRAAGRFYGGAGHDHGQRNRYPGKHCEPAFHGFFHPLRCGQKSLRHPQHLEGFPAETLCRAAAG